jgi:hypothetical protein
MKCVFYNRFRIKNSSLGKSINKKKKIENEYENKNEGIHWKKIGRF